MIGINGRINLLITTVRTAKAYLHQSRNEVLAKLRPFVLFRGLRLSCFELAAVHLARPGEPDWREFGEVSKALLHSFFAFRVAVE